MVCGTGVGASIAANKFRGIRAALCHDVYSAHQSVEHDDVNVLRIGAQIVSAISWRLTSCMLSWRPSTARTRSIVGGSRSLWNWRIAERREIEL